MHRIDFIFSLVVGVFLYQNIIVAQINEQRGMLDSTSYPHLNHTNRDPSASDLNHKVGDCWVNTECNSLWVFNALEKNQNNQKLNSNSKEDFYLSRYVVAADGTGFYATIQSALDEATASGGGIIYLKPGVYKENLNLYGNTAISSATGNSDSGTPGNTVIIEGTHKPPINGSFVFKSVRLQSESNIFSSTENGKSSLVLENCFIAITDGFLFDLPNWKGSLVTYNVGEGSVNNGMVNNKGGATCFFISATHGAGKKRTMITSGKVILQEVDLNCPWEATGKSNIASDYVIFTQTINCLDECKGIFSDCRFNSGNNQSLEMNSNGNVILVNSSFDSMNNPTIGGRGSGLLTIINCSFLNNSRIAKTLNVSSGIVRGGNFISQFVVGLAPDAQYTTVQSALDAANSLGGGTIFVKSGIYKEDLKLYADTEIIGSIAKEGGDVIIEGIHSPPITGGFAFRNLKLKSSTDIFNSTAAGKGILSISGCTFDIINGYIFNLPNWIGKLRINDCYEKSINNGIIKNSSRAPFFINNCQVGAGTLNTFTVNGDGELNFTFLDCPFSISGGKFSINFSRFSKTLTISGNAVGSIAFGDFFTGTSPALEISSENPVTLKQTSIDSSANYVITGIGAVNLGGVSFFNSIGIMDSIKANSMTTFEKDISLLDSISFNKCVNALNSDGELIIGDSNGSPRLNTLTPGPGIAITNDPGSITISQSCTLEITGQTIGAVTTDLVKLPLGKAPGTYIYEVRIAGWENTMLAGIGCKLFGTVCTTGSLASLIKSDSIICNKGTILEKTDVDVVVVGNDMIIKVTGIKDFIVDWAAHLEYTSITPHKSETKAYEDPQKIAA